MGSYHKAATREAFNAVAETCPFVDSALADAAELIKEQTTALRNALIEALERAHAAEDRVADLEAENDQLRQELGDALAAASNA